MKREVGFEIQWAIVGRDEQIVGLPSFTRFDEDFDTREAAEAFIADRLKQFPDSGRSVKGDYWWGRGADKDLETRFSIHDYTRAWLDDD